MARRLAHPLHEHGATRPQSCLFYQGLGNPQGWGGADATAALRDAGDAGAALASRALELEAELAALDHSMLQVPRPNYTKTSRRVPVSLPARHPDPRSLYTCISSRGSSGPTSAGLSLLRSRSFLVAAHVCRASASACRLRLALLQGMSMVSSQPATAAALEEQLRSWEADVARLEGLAEQVRSFGISWHAPLGQAPTASKTAASAWFMGTWGRG